MMRHFSLSFDKSTHCDYRITTFTLTSIDPTSIMRWPHTDGVTACTHLLLLHHPS